MSDLSVNFCGLRSPNPFWLASGPPTNTGGQVMRAFDAGWGGPVWKTIGDPIPNTSSIMVESNREPWHDIVRRAEDAGSDALELNFGFPHGMSERGMGAAVGQVTEYTEMITSWAKEAAKTPVISKLTPNVTDITRIAAAAEQGGADAVSLINTINSLMSVDLESFAPTPNVAGKSSHGGYCGPAVKPIALHLVSAVAKKIKIPIVGIGGIGSWKDAAEHIAVGASCVQVCTAAMHYGFRIVEDLVDGLNACMDSHGYRTID